MYQIKIVVNGKEIWLTDFPSKIISSAIAAMLQSLQDVGEIEEATIELKKVGESS